MKMNQDVYILSIETAGDICSVCLACNGELIKAVEIQEPNVHASWLTLLIDDLLKSALPFGEALSAVAVSMGPGSYTGLRIGVSTAKGLCYGWDVPLISVSSLDALFQGFKEEISGHVRSQALYAPMIDARRMEVYVKFFDSKGTVVFDTQALIIEDGVIEELSEMYDEVYLFGAGADKLKDFYSGSKIKVFERFCQSAKFMNAIAYKKFQTKKFENTAYFEPFYLKDFVPTTPKRKV